MIVEARRAKVLEIVRSKGVVALGELAAALECSESTARRDLDHWDGLGKIKRTHGGAAFVGEGTALPALEERSASAILEKQQIAAEAVKHVKDGDTVLLDGGTTTLEVAKLLVGRSLQIVTNSLPIANLFASARETDLVILGGYVYPKTGVALGPMAVRMMQDLHIHQAFLSVGGITEKGFFNSNLLLVETERQMLECSDQVVVVADHTKFGKQALACLCELSAIDTLIVDAGVTPEQGEMLKTAGVEVIVAGASEGSVGGEQDS